MANGTKTMTGPTIDVSGRTAVISLSSPDTLNGIDENNLFEIPRMISNAGRDPGITYLVVRGDRQNFCSGGSVNFLEALTNQTHDERVERLRAGQRWVSALRESPCLTVASIEGLVVGAGVDFALGFDVLLLASSARMGFFYDRLGAVPDLGGLWLLAQEVGPKKALSFYSSGAIWTGMEIIENGIGEIAEDQPQSSAEAWNTLLIKKFPVKRAAFAEAKRSLNAVHNDAFAAHQSMVRNAQAVIFGTDDFRQRLKRVASIQAIRRNRTGALQQK